MILHCKCGAQLEIDEHAPKEPDPEKAEMIREVRLAEAENWSREHREEPHGLWFNMPGVASGGTPPTSP
jgi:hypothetical protein